MFSRRTITKAAVLGLFTTLPSQLHSVFAQPGTPAAGEADHHNMFGQDVPALPPATAGEVAVVSFATGDEEEAGVLIHNASEETVGISDIAGIARDSSGSLFAVSDQTILGRYVLEPGQYGIAMVSFDKDLPAEIDITFEVKTESPNSSFMDIVDLPVTEVSIEADKVIGIVENPTELTGSSLIAVVGVFFDTTGLICGWFRTYLSDSIAPGGIATFSSSSVNGQASASYLLAASGWAE